MAATVTETATFDKPAAEVYDYVVDFSNLAEWDPTFERSERRSPGTDLQEGTRFEVVATVAGKEVHITYEITQADRPNSATLRGEGDGFVSVDRISLAPVDEGTELTWEATVDADAPIIDTLATPIFKAVAKAAISGLRDELGEG